MLLMRAMSVLAAASLLFGLACPTMRADDEMRALVLTLMTADRPAGYYPVYTQPRMVAVLGTETTPPKPEEPDPNDPDVRAQKAANTLHDLGMVAWPALIERLEDNRQSIALASEIPCTFGRACFHRIAGKVNPPRPRGYFNDYDILRDGDDVRSWWRDRQGRELRDLKIEALLFAWALAEHDGAAADARFYARELRSLDVAEPEPRAEPWRKGARGLALPQSPDELVSVLNPRLHGDFLTRRFLKERARRARWQLIQLDAVAIPALIHGLQERRVADTCMDLIGDILHDFSFEPELMNELMIVNRQNATAWWRERQSRPWRAIQLEAAQQLVDAVERRRFPSQERKDDLLKFLRGQVEELK